MRSAAFVTVLGILAQPAREKAEKCDLKTVKQGLYCEYCKKILEAADMAGDDCKVCQERGKIDNVEVAKPVKVKICVKRYFRCESHKDYWKWQAGKCGICELPLKETIDKALVIFACERCGKEGEKAGPCPDEGCKKLKKKVVKTCAKSGTPPHVPEGKE